MRAVTYESALAQASQLAFGKEQPGRADAATLNTFMNEAAGLAWRRFWFPEFMRTEERQFRPTWSGAVAVGTEVYFAPARAYYLAIKGPTTVAPAVLTGGTYVTSASEWIAVVDVSTDNEDWFTGTIYAAGDTVRNPLTDLHYACHTNHTAGASFDATKFGRIVPWRPALQYAATGETEIDGIKGIYDADPDVHLDAREIGFTLASDIVVHTALAKVWVKFRVRVPTWSGALHKAGSTYTAGNQVYYGGDFYKAIDTTTALPSDATHWTLIQFPYLLRSAVPRMAYANWLEGEDETVKSTKHMALAVELLDAEIEEIVSRQKQSRALPVRSYK